MLLFSHFINYMVLVFFTWTKILVWNAHEYHVWYEEPSKYKWLLITVKLGGPSGLHMILKHILQKLLQRRFVYWRTLVTDIMTPDFISSWQSSWSRSLFELVVSWPLNSNHTVSVNVSFLEDRGQTAALAKKVMAPWGLFFISPLTDTCSFVLIYLSNHLTQNITLAREVNECVYLCMYYPQAISVLLMWTWVWY